MSKSTGYTYQSRGPNGPAVPARSAGNVSRRRSRISAPRTRRFSMKQCWRTLMGGVAIALSSALVAAQAPQSTNTTAASKGSTPRTPWGHPDLQGIWTTDGEVGVPVERPADLGTKAVLTDDEFAKRAEALKKRNQDDKANRRSREGDTEAGPEHWYELGKDMSRRTSLVTDPPDGRIPDLTPEAKTRAVKKGTELGFVGGS